MTERRNPLFAVTQVTSKGHPTVVCSEQTTHPCSSREGQNLIVQEETNHDRTGKPVVCRYAGHEQGRATQTRFFHDSMNFNVEDDTKHDRTEKPVVCRDVNHEQSMLNEVDIDFRIPRLPHSVVIVFVNSLRRSRTTLTDNLFNEIYNKTMPKSKKMMKDMGQCGAV